MQALFPAAGVVQAIKLPGAPLAKRVGKITSGPCNPKSRNPTDRVCINRNFPVARASAGTREDRSPELRESADRDQVGDLAPCRAAVLNRRLILVHHPQTQVDVGDLGVHGSVKDSVPSPDYRFVIVGGIPGEGNPGAKIFLIRGQRGELRVQVIAQAVVQSEVWRYLPGVLPVERGQRPGVIRVGRISEALLVNLRAAQTTPLATG